MVNENVWQTVAREWGETIDVLDAVGGHVVGPDPGSVSSAAAVEAETDRSAPAAVPVAELDVVAIDSDASCGAGAQPHQVSVEMMRNGHVDPTGVTGDSVKKVS